MRKTVVLVVVAGLGLAGDLAGGQASKMSSDDRQAILDYQLTLPRANQLIVAMEAMTKYMVALPDFQDRVVTSMRMTQAERRTDLEKDPKAMEVLKKNGLTAQDYVVGLPALRMALMLAQGRPAGPSIIASPANIAFAKANLAQLKPKMDAADAMSIRE